MAINMYFSIISQGEAPGNRLVPGGALAIMESYSQWHQTAEMVEREETGSENRAFLDLYGTTLSRVERQNWRG